MSFAPVLTQRYIFGLSTDIKQTIHFIEDNVVLYVAGHTIVLHNQDTNKQRFITGSEGGSITALAVAPNKRFVAIAEKGEKANITIFDVHTLRKRKVMNSGLVPEYIWLSFSPDGRYLLSLGCAPDYLITNWLWEKIRPIHNIKLGPLLSPDTFQRDHLSIQEGSSLVNSANIKPLRRCSFCPADPSLVAACGQGSLFLFRIESETSGTGASTSSLLNPVDLNWDDAINHDFTCMDWIDHHLFVGTRVGRVFHVCNASFRGEIMFQTGAYPIYEILTFSKGMAIGGKSGFLCLIDILSISDQEVKLGQPKLISLPIGGGGATSIDKADEQDNEDEESGASLTHKKLGVVPNSWCNICSIASSTNDEHLAIVLTNCLSFVINISNLDILKSEEIRIEPLLDSFHAGGILAIDTCIRKPIIASCAEDQSIRIWNYSTTSLSICKYFAEAPLSLSLHPSGLHLLVGFTDKVRLLNVLMDDLRTYKEFSIKNCQLCRFSRGGHMFAAINGSIIVLYATYTGELIATLRGHNQKISSLFWSADDTSLVSCGLDGAVYEFCVSAAASALPTKLTPSGGATSSSEADTNATANSAMPILNVSGIMGMRQQEFVQKGCKYYSATCTSNHEMYATGSDRLLKQISESTVHKELDSGALLTELVIGNVRPEHMMFGGSDDGFIRSFKFPLTGHCQDYPCHSSTVTSMRLTIDDALLFTASKDGCIAIFEVREKEGRSLDAASAIVTASSVAASAAESLWSEEVLASRADLEDSSFAMSELKNKVDELTLHNEYQMRLREMSHLDAVKEIKETFQLRIEEGKRRYDLLKDEKQDMEMEYEENVKSLEDSHNSVVAQLKQQHQEEIMAEVERFHDLEKNMRQQEEFWDREAHLADEQHQDRMDAKQIDIEQELERERERHIRLTKEHQAIAREYEETKSQLEQDTDTEIIELRQKFEATLGQEREATLRLKGENGIMKKRFSSLANDIEDQKEELKLITEKEEELKEKTMKLKEEIEDLKRKITRRDATIGEKERKIYELKKRNQELEKHKFVLDFQIKELKRQIEPRENKIAEMKEDEHRVDGRLEKFHARNSDYQKIIENLQELIKTSQKLIDSKRKTIREGDLMLARQRHDVRKLVNFIQDPPNLQQKVRQMHDTYVNDAVTSADVDPQVMREYKRQRGFLERSVDQLKKQLSNHSHSNRRGNLRILQENVELIRETNELRTELRMIQMVQQEKIAASKIVKRGTNPGNQVLDQLRQRVSEQEAIIANLQSTLYKQRLSKQPQNQIESAV